MLREIDQRMGAGTAPRRRAAAADDDADELLIAKTNALARNRGARRRRGDEDVEEDEEEESEDDEADDERHGRELALRDASSQGSRALQILKINPQVKNYSQERMFLPAIHKSLAPKIRTEMKTSTFRPKLPAWAEPKKEHIEIAGSLDDVGDALEANQKFQLDIRALLEGIDDKLAKNAVLQQEVTRSRNRKGRRTHWSLQESMLDLWGAKSDLYFRIPSAWTPAQRTSVLGMEDVSGIISQAKLQKQITPNADQLRLGWANLVDKIPLSYGQQAKVWTAKEDAQLRKGVHFQLQQARLLTDQRMSLEELAGMSVQPLDTLLEAGGLDIITRDSEAINWNEVVRMHMPHRTIEDCRLHWMNKVDPRICSEDWTEAEDDALVALAEATVKTRDWIEVAEKLHAKKKTPHGLVRTPYQCAVRYQSEWNPSLVKSSWSDDEDAFIRKWVNENGAGNWTKLARLLPGHTGQQLLHRWRRLQPTRRKGAWTTEEDEALRVAVSAYREGERIKWSRVASQIPTRTDVQCRERWTGVLDPSIKTDAWSAEEDAALLSALGPNFTNDASGFNEWSRLAAVCPGRTGKICMRRVKFLIKQKAAKEAAKSAKKRGRPSKGAASEALGDTAAGAEVSEASPTEDEIALAAKKSRRTKK